MHRRAHAPRADAALTPLREGFLAGGLAPWGLPGSATPFSSQSAPPGRPTPHRSGNQPVESYRGPGAEPSAIATPRGGCLTQGVRFPASQSVETTTGRVPARLGRADRCVGERAGGAAHRRAAAVATACGVLAVATAAGTECDWLYPAGARVGETVRVQLSGRLSAWPLAVWCDDPGLQFRAAAAPGHFEVTLATNTAPGPHLIRFFDSAGASAPCQFVAGEFPELLWPETADTNAPPDARLAPAAPPVTLQGRLETDAPGHIWPLALPGPATLHLVAVASRLDSPGTVRLTVRDAGGAVLGRSTNAPPADPEFECLVATSGTYALEVLPAAVPDTPASPARQANAPILYRITVTTRGAERTAALIPAGAWLEGAPRPDTAARVVIREVPPAAEPVLHPETLSPTTELAGTFGGFINPAGDQDRFGFLTRREQTHRFRARAVNPDSAFVPVLRVLDAAGAVLAESVPGVETALEWTAPADGAYVLAVADAFDAGGPDFGYELELAPPQPRVTATTPEHTFPLAPGQSRVLPLQVRRPDTAHALLTVTASGLPADVSAGSAILAPDAERVDLELRVAERARPFSGPFRVLVLDPATLPPRTFPVTAPVSGRHAPPGGLLINETDVFWLSVGGL